MRVLITTLGSHGDLHPFLAIGRALRERGHAVALMNHPHFRVDVEAAGIEFRPMLAHVDHAEATRDPDLMHRRRGGLRVLRYLGEATPHVVERLRGEVRAFAPDVLLAHHIVLAAPWVARECGLPLACAALSPMGWLNPRDSVPALQQHEGRLFERLARAAERGLLPVGLWVADRWVNRLRRQAGFPPGRGLFRAAFVGGDRNLAMWSPRLRPPIAGDPPHGVVCGFPWYDGGALHAGLPAGLEAFLDAGDPPVVFSLGTAAVHSARDFYLIAAEACRRIGRRGVLLHGGVAPLPERLPAGLFAAAYAPFSRLLPRAAATVHHGGIGSTAQALRAGRPQVVVPHAHDQFNNALRCVKLEVAAMVARHRLTPRRLARALQQVLDDPAYATRAAELGDRLRGEDGAAIAAREIEALSASRPIETPVRS